MKYIIVFTLLLCSCVANIEADMVVYYRDPRTGICFSELRASSNSLTCVPCDSLKHVIVHDFK